MSAQERLRRALDTIESAAREQQDRRELTERRVAEMEAKAKDAFRKEIDAAMRYADHMAELQRRKTDAGGWETEKTLADKDNVMAFGVVEEDERPSRRAFAEAAERTEPATPRPRPARHSRRDDFDDEDFSNNSWLE